MESKGDAAAGSKVVLVAVDGSRMSYLAFDAAVRLAAASKLVVLHITVPDVKTLPGHFTASFLKFEFERRCLKAGVAQSSVMIVEKEGSESIKDVILRTSRQVKADLLVLGQFGTKGTSSFASGSNTDWSVRVSAVSTAIVKINSEVKPLDVPATHVVCVDGSAMTWSILAAALKWRRSTDIMKIFHVNSVADYSRRTAIAGVGSGTHLQLATAKAVLGQKVPTESLPADLQAQILEYLAKSGVTAEIIVRQPVPGVNAARTICAFAEEVEATVLTIGADSMAKYASGVPVLGSTSDAVIKQVRCTTLVVKRPTTS